MSILKTLAGIYYMMSSLKIFKAEETFKNKRIAVIGAANSAFSEKNGSYIDDFDIVVRVNKAPHNLNAENIPTIENCDSVNI